MCVAAFAKHKPKYSMMFDLLDTTWKRGCDRDCCAGNLACVWLGTAAFPVLKKAERAASSATEQLMHGSAGIEA